jgi:hypothetical protein
MRSTTHHRKCVLGPGLVGIVALFSGCERKQPVQQTLANNNLRYVKCKKRLSNYSGITEILVNAKDGIAYEDEIVFVCTDEKLHWKADAGVKTIEISFLNNEWPFKEALEATLSGTSQTNTPDRQVKDLPNKLRVKAYKYKIHVVTDAGATIDLDPTIIPMDD